MTSFEWWKRHSPMKLELNSFVVFKPWELIPFNPVWSFQLTDGQETIHVFV
jgi:hypothetical protein